MYDNRKYINLTLENSELRLSRRQVVIRGQSNSAMHKLYPSGCLQISY